MTIKQIPSKLEQLGTTPLWLAYLFPTHKWLYIPYICRSPRYGPICFMIVWFLLMLYFQCMLVRLPNSIRVTFSFEEINESEFICFWGLCVKFGEFGEFELITWIHQCLHARLNACIEFTISFVIRLQWLWLNCVPSVRFIMVLVCCVFVSITIAMRSLSKCWCETPYAK